MIRTHSKSDSDRLLRELAEWQEADSRWDDVFIGLGWAAFLAGMFWSVAMLLWWWML
jgi:hypothetical protein